MELNGYLRLIWDSKRWLLLFAVVAAVVVYLLSSSRTDEYESSALGQIVSTSQASGEILSEEQLLSLSNVYHELAATRTVLEIAHEDPQVQGRVDEFDASVDVSPESRVGALAFSAITPDRERSADFANAYAVAFRSYLGEIQIEQRQASLEPIQRRIEEITADLEELSPTDPEAASLQVELDALQNQIAEQTANPGDSMRIVERAVPSGDPASPQPRRDALLAFVVALILGAAAVYLRDLFFDRYGSAQEISRDLGLQLLGEIPKGRQEVPLESFRSLRAAIIFALERSSEPSINGSELGSGSILVTGPESGCGKSYVSANLARTLATEGRQVALIDADLRRPTQHEAFGLRLSPGLSDLLLTGGDGNQLSDIEVAVGLPPNPNPGKLRVTPAGAHAEEAVESLSSARMRSVVEQLRDENDMLVFDSPPTPVVVDPVVLARYADGVVVVIDARHSRRREARRAIEALRATGAPLLGFAYNRSATKQSRYDAYRPSDPRRSSAQPRESRV